MATTPIYDTPLDWKAREGEEVNKVPPIEALLLEIYNQIQGIAAGTVAGNAEIISSTNFVPVTTGAECTAALNFAIANLRAIGYTVTDFNTWSYYDTDAAATIFAWTIKYVGTETGAAVLTTFDVSVSATASFVLDDAGTAIIDWGDGTIEEIVTGTITHTYPGSSGIFDIRIFSATINTLDSFTANAFGDFTINSDTLTQFSCEAASLVTEISLNCPNLGRITIESSPITVLDLSTCIALLTIGIRDCNNLTTLDFTALALASGIDCSDNANLASVNITGLPLLVEMLAANCILPVSNVNSILVALLATGLPNGTCDLSGQTPAAAPTGAGAAAAADLVTDGWTVTTD
jgi:hypothetical protein